MKDHLPQRALAFLIYGAFLAGVYAAVVLIPTIWISLSLSVLFLYFSCLFMLGFMESKYVSPPAIEKYPTISIVIPAWNRGKSLQKCMAHMKAMEYPKPVQIIVVNDASTDGTKELLAKTKGIIAVNFEKNSGKAAAVNHGISLAKSEFIAIADGDSYPNPDCLMKMIPHFYEKENVGAVTGVVRVNNVNGLLQKIQEVEYCIGFGLYNTVLSHFDSLFVTPGPLSIYRKAALEKAGGFDSHCITEDMEITFHLHQLGYNVVLEPNAQIYSDVPDTLKKLFRQRMRWSRGGFYTAYKYRSELFSQKKLFFQFFFPMKLILDLSAIFFLIMILRLAWETLSGVGGAWHTISSIAFERLPYIPIYLNSSLTFLFVMLGVTSILIWFGAQATGRKTTELSLWGVLLFIFVYGSFIVSVYFYSLTKAILGAEQKW